MDVLEISRLTDEFVRVPVRGRDSGSDIDPTSYAVSVAFVAAGTRPAPTDYAAATWETDATVSPSRYYARRKATTLASQDWSIWVKIVTGSETVQKAVGLLRVT